MANQTNIPRDGSAAALAGDGGTSSQGGMESSSFESAMAHGAIPGRPQRDIEPHISAANAAGIFAEGSRFGVYIVGPCIGHGGMARIYRAEHEGLRRQVALKVLTDGFAHDGEGRRRFLREARIAAAIKHPNVVNIFDVGVQDGIPYLVMELLEGEDLESLLHTKSALDEGSIIDVIVPVVAGLAAVHDAGVVHRDLKPGNIFLAAGRNEETEPKLLDFGISKASGKGHMKLTSATKGLLMGTPFYMSPEAIQGVDMTPLSDQYSLGVLLYECATGVNPFSADTFAETVRRITTGEYPALSAHPSRPSKRLVRIIERAMSVASEDRFPDMRALGRELLMLAGQRTRITWSLSFGEVATTPKSETATIVLEEKADVGSSPRSMSSRPPGPPTGPRSPATIAAVVLGALAFLGALGLVVQRGGPGEAPPPPVAAQRVVEKTNLLRPLLAPEVISDEGTAAAPAEKAREKVVKQEAKPPVRRKSRPTRVRRTRSRRRVARPAPRRKVEKVVVPKPAEKATVAAAKNVAPEWARGLKEQKLDGVDQISGTNNAPIFD